MEKLLASLKKIEPSPKLSEQVEAQLYDAIQKNVFLYGTYLPGEHELAKIFNVSRGVIREALLRLSARGIIDMQKGKGAQVLKPSLDHVLDPFARFVNYRCGNDALIYILNVRRIIEPSIAALAAEHRTDEDLKHLSECISEQKQSIGDKIKMSEWDIEFHQTLARASQNPIIPIIIRPLFDVLEKFHFPVFNDNKSLMERTVKSHESILDAIVKKDIDGAKKLMEKHLSGAENNPLYKSKK